MINISAIIMDIAWKVFVFGVVIYIARNSRK